MYILSKDGETGAKAELKSDHMMLYEGDTKCLSFWYILDDFDASERSLKFLSVHTLDTEDNEFEYWHLNSFSPNWRFGQVLINCLSMLNRRLYF